MCRRDMDSTGLIIVDAKAGIFFFFKQKAAYDVSACLVGSEVCIRDKCMILSVTRACISVLFASPCCQMTPVPCKVCPMVLQMCVRFPASSLFWK